MAINFSPLLNAVDFKNTIEAFLFIFVLLIFSYVALKSTTLIKKSS
jgi:hypothetical protein